MGTSEQPRGPPESHGTGRDSGPGSLWNAISLPSRESLAAQGLRASQGRSPADWVSLQSLKVRRPAKLFLHKTASYVLQCTQPGAKRFCLKSDSSPSFLDHGTCSRGTSINTLRDTGAPSRSLSTPVLCQTLSTRLAPQRNQTQTRNEQAAWAGEGMAGRQDETGTCVPPTQEGGE